MREQLTGWGCWLARWLIAAPVCLLYLTCFAVVVAVAAPVPPHRPAKPVSLVGSWRMTWGGAIFDVGFAPDGYYCCQDRWEGSWRLDGNTLTVTEWLRDSEFPPTTWTAELVPGKREGKLRHGGVFRLESIPAPTPQPAEKEEVILCE